MTSVDDIIAHSKAVERSAALSNIERKAKWVRDDALSIARYVRSLASLPNFDTLAEEAVVSALAALHEAIQITAEADAVMKAKRARQQYLEAAE
jgi:hypothetical protein